MHFERAEPDSDTKTYTFLYNCLSQRIELNRQSNSRPARIAIRGKEHPTKPGAPGPKAKADGRGKARGISKGRDGGGGDAPPNGPGGEKSSNSAPANACFSYWKTGKCPEGRNALTST